MSITNPTLQEFDTLIYSLDFFAETATAEVNEDSTVYHLRNFRNRNIELVVNDEEIAWCEFVESDSDGVHGYSHFDQGRDPIDQGLDLLKAIGHEKRFRLEKIMDMTKENPEVAVSGIEYGTYFNDAVITLESGNIANVSTIGDIGHKTAIIYQVFSPAGDELTLGVFENESRKAGAKTLAKVLKEY